MSLAFGFALPHWKILSGGFSPASLFTAGEQGAWYDPSDYGPTGTLFQDAAGTTPTTMETRARLMLDKSKGLVLGPELVTNGDFSSGTTGWTVGASWVVSTGQAVTTSSSGYLIQSPFPAGDPIGATYQVTLVCSGVSGTVFIGGGQYTSTTLQNGTRTLYLQRTGTSNNILYIGTGGGNATIISISIKAIAGNHATAPSDASSPILRARYNLLTYSEDFSNAAWMKSNATVSANTTTAPDGTTTADKLVENTASAEHYTILANLNIPVANSACTASVYVKSAERTSVHIRNYSGGSPVAQAFFNTLTQTFSGIIGGSWSFENVGNGWYRIQVVAAHTNASSNGIGVFLVSGTSTLSYTGDGTSGIFVWGADFRLTTDAALNIPAYQSITTATSYDTNGFPPYLAFDGTDDSFSTASIDFTGTDKMTVFAGTTRLSDAAVGIVAELSANFNSNAGTFIVTMPDGANSKVSAALSQGNGINYNAGEYTDAAAPSTAINAVYFDKSVSTDEVAFIRKNGVAQTLVRAVNNNTTGNFGNYPLYIGRRNNTSFPFNGRIYSLIIRGASTTTPLIASTEQWVAGKMRLPI